MSVFAIIMFAHTWECDFLYEKKELILHVNGKKKIKGQIGSVCKAESISPIRAG